MKDSRSEIPWKISLLIIAVFFLADHNIFYSVRDTLETSLDTVVTETAEGNSLRRAVILLLGLAGLAGLWLRGKFALSSWSGTAKIILFFLGWAFLSLIWSEDAALTARRLIAFSMFCLAALAAVRHLTIKQIIWATFLSSGFFLLAGIGAEAVLHTFQPFSPEYRFQGTVHPNEQSTNCALLLISSFYLRKESPGGKYMLLFTGLALLFLLLTKSRTSFFAIVAALGIYWSFRSPAVHKHALITAISLTMALLLPLGEAAIPALTRGVSLGRAETTSTSLNGRLPLWQECFKFVDSGKALLFGYGYGGFWTPVRIKRISLEQRWGGTSIGGVGSAHSAYIDVLLQTGVIGLFLYIALLIGVIRRSYRMFRVSVKDAGFILVIFIFGVVQSLLESTVFSHSISTLLFLTLFFLVGFRILRTTGGPRHETA
ncbi:MAG: O-antigen ligase family protein [Candidatus Latescibacterota bacterium]